MKTTRKKLDRLVLNTDVEVTPDMIEAGCLAKSIMERSGTVSDADIVWNIYQAMVPYSLKR